LIMEGATEKVSKSIMPMKTNYNKIFSFNEQKYILNISERLKQKLYL
jgi:hypothetical protein